jgi:hypothetical protein
MLLIYVVNYVVTARLILLDWLYVKTQPPRLPFILYQEDLCNAADV